MRTKLIYLLIIFSISLQAQRFEAGWYHLSDTKPQRPVSSPIVTKNDFKQIRLSAHSSEQGKIMYAISIQLKEEKIEKWRIATGKAIGKSIGFIIQNKLVASPRINCEIEKGTSQITGYDRKAFLSYLQELGNKEEAANSELFMQIAEGILTVPDSIKNEFKKRECLLQTQWSTVPLSLSSTANDYFNIGEYKNFKNYVLNAPASVNYLLAEMFLQEPKGLLEFMFNDIMANKYTNGNVPQTLYEYLQDIVHELKP
ncbi:MAG: hypothetical protein RRY36_02820 [Bacteroidaceae bacterium]